MLLFQCRVVLARERQGQRKAKGKMLDNDRQVAQGTLHVLLTSACLNEI